jgi:hypothetical protein
MLGITTLNTQCGKLESEIDIIKRQIQTAEDSSETDTVVQEMKTKLQQVEKDLSLLKQERTLLTQIKETQPQ